MEKSPNSFADLPPGAAAYQRRVREVENAVLSQTYGGHPPTPAALHELQRYIAGEVSREEGFRALYDRPGPAKRQG